MSEKLQQTYPSASCLFCQANITEMLPLTFLSLPQELVRALLCLSDHGHKSLSLALKAFCNLRGLDPFVWWATTLQHQIFIREGQSSLYFEPRGTLFSHFLLKIVWVFWYFYLLFFWSVVPFAFMIITVSAFSQIFHYLSYSITYSHSPPPHTVFSGTLPRGHHILLQSLALLHSKLYLNFPFLLW